MGAAVLDLNSALTDALQAAADDEVHVERLLDGARSRGLRYRRRRHLAALGGAVLSVALLLGGLVPIPPLWAAGRAPRPGGPPRGTVPSAPVPGVVAPPP